MRWMRAVWPTNRAHRSVAVGLSLLTVLSAAVILIDRFFVTREPVAPTLQSGRIVAVGTKPSDSFRGMFPANEPSFAICPFSPTIWRLGFDWNVYVKGSSASFIKTAPQVYVAGPPDMFDVEPERSVQVDMISGAVEHTNIDLSSTQVVDSNPSFKMVALKPKRVVEQPTGDRVAYYGFWFKTRKISSGRYGLGERGFNVSYVPPLMEANGLTPGVGETSTSKRGTSSALSIRTCNSRSARGYRFREDEFVPAPSETAPQQTFVWKLTVRDQLTITGIVYGGPSHSLRQASGWFLASSLAALLGVLYAAAAGQSGNRTDIARLEERTQKEPEPTPPRTLATNQKRNQSPGQERSKAKKRRRRR
jgi:hypothetical protein